ncbi:indolethylamine N-methyltransferase-like [Anomaloglossus baeobatrachus]|uniref:indolethylamine N-methyltransferase-like n=1 Tax=Anomaloglossus baeobatrachus TaxID=238106 RepID=UPI003F4F49BD
MDPCTHKLYHDEGFDSRQWLEHYFSDKSALVFRDDITLFPIECFAKTFSEGHIKGDVLIDLSVGPLVHHLFAACEYFKHIVVMKVSDRCIMELKRWVDERTGAFDWGHAAKLHAYIDIKSDQLENKEQNVRSALYHVVKCDLEKENMMDPIVLPPADCVISFWLLDAISKDQDDYRRHLRKFSKLLKPGGHIILIGSLDATYYTVGKHKFHILTYDENFVRKALAEQGFIIDCYKRKERIIVDDLCDCKVLFYIVAHKEK